METPPPLPGLPPPVRPPPLWHESAQAYEPDTDPTGPAGLGGWLILMMFMFIIGIPSLAYHLFNKWRIFFAPSGERGLV